MPFTPGPTYFNDQGRNVIPDHVKQLPEHKSFFDTISVVMQSLKDQDSRNTKRVALPEGTDMAATSNYGITVQEWFDHNFGAMYGIAIEWKP